VFGVGEGNITDDRYLGKQAHNTYLELLAEDGIIAFGLFAAIIGWLGLHLWRRRAAFREPGAYAVVHSFGCGYLALLIAIVPTSALTITLLWIQPAILMGLTRVYGASPHRVGAVPQPAAAPL
jgi:O-antigen ligase